MEMSVEAAGFRHQVVGQGVQIGRFELGCLAPGKDFADDRMLALKGGKRLFVGSVLAGFGLLGFLVEVELSEKNLAELLG